MTGLIIDLFAGGGGASTGIEAALRLLDGIVPGDAHVPPGDVTWESPAVTPCPVPGCVRVKGHPSFHCTSEQIAKREDGR